MKIGVISGHRISDLEKNFEKIPIETLFGDTYVEVSKLGKDEIFYINRHGETSNIPPHKVNYLANIQAFDSCHVECIFSICTVGSMKNNIRPNDLVIPHDFIDFTRSRNQTFFDDKRVHVDMLNPFCPSLRNTLINSCKKMKDINFHEKSIYLTTEGPRLETISEIKFYSNFTDVVGMTLASEVVLAREKSICYVSLCVVCNMAAGLQDRLNADEITLIYKKREPIVSKILLMSIADIDVKRNCNCKYDLTKVTL